MEQSKVNKINLIPGMSISISKFNRKAIFYGFPCEDLNIDGTKPIKYKITYPLNLSDYGGEFKCHTGYNQIIWMDISDLIGDICNLYRMIFRKEKPFTEGGKLYHELKQLYIEALILDLDTNELDIRVGS